MHEHIHGDFQFIHAVLQVGYPTFQILDGVNLMGFEVVRHVIQFFQIVDPGRLGIGFGVAHIKISLQRNDDRLGLRLTGGMPESVKMWTEARDVSAMQEALSDIISAYERDFAKHPNLTEFPKISMIWKSVPSQLARENKKFIYKVVKEGARAREYEDALQLLSVPTLELKHTGRA